MIKADKMNIEDILALTPNQEGLLFHYLQNQGEGQYNIQLTLTLRGSLDISIFKQAWEEVINCNEILRTVFSWIGIKQPLQIVMKNYTPVIDFYDCTRHPGRVDELRKQDKLERFDLETACYRIKLCTLSQTEHVLVFSIHHIIYDGWSNGILWKEFFTAYNQLEKAGKVRLGAKTRYKQFIKQFARLDKGRQKEFWQNYLENIDEISLLKQKKTDVYETGESFSSLRTELEKDMETRLTAFLKKNNLSLSDIVYAVWGLLLQFYCNSDKVLFGRISSGRNIDLSGIQEMVGFFINIHPLRIAFQNDMTVAQYLHNVKANILDLGEYETTPLSHIMDYLGYRGKREPFNSIVVVENYPLDRDLIKDENGLYVENYSVSETNHYDLTLSVEVFTGIAFNIIYKRGEFDEPFVQGIAEHFHNLLVAILDGIDLKLSAIPILTQKQQNRILQDFNATAVPLPSDQTVLEVFEAQVVRAPDALALISEEGSLTYEAFNAQVNQLAHHLRGLGVGPNTIVAVLAERSLAMLIGIFGIVKAGGAYLPLDPHHPTNRIQAQIEDAGVHLLVAQPAFFSQVPEHLTIVNLDMLSDLKDSCENPVKINQPGDACYVIYTSGTTGKPKGVVIEHRPLLDRLLWMQKNTPIGPGDTVLQKTTTLFDVSVWELFWWGMQGARLCLLENGAERDPQRLLETIHTQQITTLHFAPSMLQMFVLSLKNKSAPAQLTELKYMLAIGEELTPTVVRQFYQAVGEQSSVQLVNLYGPTEATINVSSYLCPREGGELERIPIGTPIDNTQLYVVSPTGQLQPIGLAGELCIGGMGLARGYLNRPELTAQRFVTYPFSQGNRLYRTGDLARWLPNGHLEYLGRIDTQVKVRGYRIELGEIENCIRSFDGVQDVLALVKEHTGGDKHIYAYILSNEDIDVKILKRYLLQNLPQYMIPAFFINLKHFPVKFNGKVDRAELERMGSAKEGIAEQAAVLPQRHIEKQIIDIWKEVLSSENIGIDANYFDIGGNSINLIRIYGRLQPLFPDKINSITVLFQYPTVASLFNYLTDGIEEEREETGIRPGNSDPGAQETKDLAIIGMSGRFPGAENIREYWENLSHGTESIHFFSEEELIEAGIDADLIKNPDYVKAIGKLKDARHFDAKFFGFSSKEAELLDPQIRLFMECVWETLEDAGYASQCHNEVIGLYAGASPNPFWEAMALQTGETQALGDFASEKLINKDNISSQISYKLNLTGPVFSLYTACSTSLVAVHLACQAVLSNECSMAIAGGVSSVAYYGEYGYVYQEGMVFSPDGHCRAFDESAQGFVGGMGVGSIILKRLDKAIEDRDNIYAVIKGTAINNDGNRKVGYTALSIEAQVETIRTAMAKAGVVPESIGYVETHGTGTELGDPVELKALELAFKSQERNFCAVGSVKPCIGHLDCASGIASLIKTVLALKHAKIPPAVNFNIPNTKINFIDSPFYVNTELEEWKRGKYPLRAGVNSLGQGGTNAHVILEELIPEKCDEVSYEEQNLLTLSAKSREAFVKQSANLKRFIENNYGIDISDIAYTLQVGRQAFDYRKAFRYNDRTSVTKQLALVGAEECCKVGKAYSILFVLNGSEHSYQNFDVELCYANPVVKNELDRCNDIVTSLIKIDFRKEILGDTAWKEKIETLKLTSLSGFIYQYIVTRCLVRMGVKPSYLAGDGSGEILSACLSGILNLKEAILLILHLYHNDIYKIPQRELDAIAPKIPTIPSYSEKIKGWIPREIAINKQYWLTLDTQTPVILKNIRDEILHNGNGQEILVLGESSLDNIDCLPLPKKSSDRSGTTQLLDLLGILWEKGVNIDWRAYHSYHKHRRVSLPTYPFERKEYWIQGNLLKSNVPEKTGDTSKNSDISDWFYVPVWESLPLQDAINGALHRWLIFMNDHQFNKRLTDELIKNRNVVLVRTGIAFNKINDTTYEINIHNENDYLQLLDELGQNNFYADRIVHTCCINSDSPEEALPYGFLSILYLVRAISARSSEQQIELNVFTRNTCCVTGSEELQPEYAMVTSACMVASQEIPFIKCRQIDIDILVQPEWKEINLVGQLVAELQAPISNPIIAYRKNNRWVKNYKQIKFEVGSDRGIKENGIYVLVGGLGGVGLVLSQALAEKKAKIILVGRSKFPPKSAWEEWIKKNGPSDATSNIITKLMRMEEKGAEICTISADATDEDQMNGMFEFVYRKYGNVNGVIYAPVAKGASYFKTINEVSVDDCLHQFKPKVDGLKVLEKVLGQKALDFCLIMSSTSSILGGLGFVAYSAANTFMDTFTLRHNSEYPTSWITVNWESWDVETNQNAFSYEAEIKELMMTPQEGIAVFSKLLNVRNIGQMVISSGNLHSRVEKWVYMNILNALFQNKERVRELRPELANQYIAPQNELEEQIASVWREYFSIDKIGVDDNLFDLGATSLSIIQLNNNLRNKINKNIPIVKFFTYPTIRTLAAYLAGTLEESRSIGVERSQEVDKGRNSARLRLELRKKA